MGTTTIKLGWETKPVGPFQTYLSFFFIAQHLVKTTVYLKVSCSNPEESPYIVIHYLKTSLALSVHIFKPIYWK